MVAQFAAVCKRAASPRSGERPNTRRIPVQSVILLGWHVPPQRNPWTITACPRQRL